MFLFADDTLILDQVPLLLMILDLFHVQEEN
jgi:hypothetical protein